MPIPPKRARLVHAAKRVFLALFGEESEVVDSLENADCARNALPIAHIMEMHIATLEHIGILRRDDVAIEPRFGVKTRVESARRDV